jgi:hypothetical protein
MTSCSRLLAQLCDGRALFIAGAALALWVEWLRRVVRNRHLSEIERHSDLGVSYNDQVNFGGVADLVERGGLERLSRCFAICQKIQRNPFARPPVARF